MPRLVINIDQALHRRMEEPTRCLLAWALRKELAFKFELSPDELEVRWLVCAESQNADNLCIDVQFSVGENGVFVSVDKNQALVDQASECLLNLLKTTSYLPKGISIAVWMMPIPNGKYKSTTTNGHIPMRAEATTRD